MNNKKMMLEAAGCKEVELYCLVENYGYTFVKGNTKYDLRRWVNCYGEAVDYWELSKVEKCFGTFEEVVEYIKSL